MAVYTKISESDAAEFLQSYDLGNLVDLIGIRSGVENTNYFLNTTSGRYVLTLFEKRVQAEDLPFFIGLMEHLADNNIPCPRPIKNKSGQALGTLAGKNAVVINFLEGAALTRIAPHDCAELGRGLAAMHQAVVDFTMHRANALSLPGWEKMVAYNHARADEIFVGLVLLLQNEITFLKENWPQDLPRGVIHADLFPDNVFFKNGKLCGLIDFTFACDDYFIYDVAVCLNAWCFERDTAFNITKARALLKGYEEIRPLSAEEKKLLPVLARGSALRFLLTRLFDWLHHVPEALVKAKDPLEYLTRLQFHQGVKDVTAYGLDV